MTLTWDMADLIFRIVQILIIPAGVWIFQSFRSLNREVGHLRERLSTAEARIAEAPSAKSLHELSLSVERMSGNLKALGERMGGIDRVVDRVDKMVTRQETYLLSGVGK